MKTKTIKPVSRLVKLKRLMKLLCEKHMMLVPGIRAQINREVFALTRSAKVLRAKWQAWANSYDGHDVTAIHANWKAFLSAFKNSRLKPLPT